MVFKKENTFDNIKNDTNINNLDLEKINKYIYLVRKKIKLIYKLR